MHAEPPPGFVFRISGSGYPTGECKIRPYELHNRNVSIHDMYQDKELQPGGWPNLG